MGTKEDQPARLRAAEAWGAPPGNGIEAGMPSAGGYKSGLIIQRGTRVTRSTSRTRSAGTLPRSIHPETVDWLKSSSLPKALCPQLRAPVGSRTASQAAMTPARHASATELLMPDITVENGIESTAKNGDSRIHTSRMGRKPVKPASAFWKRLEESLGRKQKYQPFNANNLARVLQIKQSVTQQWYAGDSEPELWRVKELARESGVCIDWLVNNIKPKYPIHKDPLLQELFDLCEGLPAGSRETILSVARGELAKLEREQGSENAKEIHQRTGGLRAV